jgi:hypothetical protein
MFVVNDPSNTECSTSHFWHIVDVLNPVAATVMLHLLRPCMSHEKTIGPCGKRNVSDDTRTEALIGYTFTIVVAADAAWFLYSLLSSVITTKKMLSMDKNDI